MQHRRTFLKFAAASGVASGVSFTTKLFAAQQSAPWPDRRLLDLFRIEHPIVQAPMGGHTHADLPVAVSQAGGLGSLPCALLSPAQIRAEVATIRARSRGPINLNFFCHTPRPRDPATEAAWQQRLAAYYAELMVDQPALPGTTLAPFGAEQCELALELKPDVASFHFGLPAPALIDRLKAAGCKIISSATTVSEARWLEDHGADAVIAQGLEAGGHRGIFLTTELDSQLGTFALIPQVADALRIPVIAAGGIADGRGIAAALALGAAGVQMGTAYLLCPEANTSSHYRTALKAARQQASVITNVLTGHPARVFGNRLTRELGALATHVPAFSLPGTALGALRMEAEFQGSTDFSTFYAGQAAALGRELPAGELTKLLAAEALARLGLMGRGT